MIKLENVTKFFKTKNGKKYILRNVNMTLPGGINIGILGVNGVGKSTFLRILGKIDFPNSGRVVSNKTFSWPMGLAGGFQGSMTGRQNVRFVCRIHGLSEKEIRKKIDFIKEFSELGDYFDMPIKTYSSGMKSRLSFALSLIFDFDYLLIDETLSVGDMRFKEKSKQALMEKISKSNVLMVSHSMKDLKDICDAGIVLHNGKLEYYEDINDAVLRYEEINLLESGMTLKDFKNLFYKDRNKFIKFVKEVYIYLYQNRLYISFLTAFNKKKYLTEFGLDNLFLLKLNETTKNLINKLPIIKDKDVLAESERKLILHFMNFIETRFESIKKYYYLPDDIVNGWQISKGGSIFFKRRLFFKAQCEKNFDKLSKEEIEKRLINYEKI